MLDKSMCVVGLLLMVYVVGKIPEPFYSRLKTALYNYEVEIDD